MDNGSESDNKVQRKIKILALLLSSGWVGLVRKFIGISQLDYPLLIKH